MGRSMALKQWAAWRMLASTSGQASLQAPVASCSSLLKNRAEAASASEVLHSQPQLPPHRLPSQWASSSSHQAVFSWQPFLCASLSNSFSTSSHPPDGKHPQGTSPQSTPGQAISSAPSSPATDAVQHAADSSSDKGRSSTDQPSTSGGMLSRVRHILPGLFKRAGLSRPADVQGPPASQAAGSSPAEGGTPKEASSKQSDKDKEMQETLEQYENLAKMDLDGHRSLLSSDLTQQTEPVPQVPPVPRWHRDYTDFLDERRVVYLQTKQHIAILDCLTDEHKHVIMSKGKAVLRDKQLLAEVAEASKARGVEYLDMEVHDCLKTFFSSKDRGRRMLVWVRDLKQPPPESMEAAQKAEDAVRLLEARDWLMERMRFSLGPAACSLHQARAWAGSGACCENTGLPYNFCCGGKPIPAHVAEVFMSADEEGLSYDTREFRRRLDKVTPPNRFTRRPKPLNHLLPPREGSPRLASHDRLMRKSRRQLLEPKFDKHPNMP